MKGPAGRLVDNPENPDPTKVNIILASAVPTGATITSAGRRR